MTGYPVAFDVDRPDLFDRAQAVLRLLIFILMSIVGTIVGWLFGVVYLLVPVGAAILISQTSPERYVPEESKRVTGWLRWTIAAYAYLLFLTDRLPGGDADEAVRFAVRAAGTPTVGSALLRLVTSLPSAIVLALLGLVSGVAWIVCFATVLVYEGVPRSLYGFQRGIVRWQARLLAYHASLVEEYPPFSLETGPEPAHASRPPGTL